MTFDDLVPIPSQPGHYATSDGRVFELRERNQLTDSNGYRVVCIRRKRQYVHRLVAEAFHGKPRPREECRHLNGIPDDNRAENLAWGSTRENMEDRRRHGTLLQGEKMSHSKLRREQVVEIKKRLRAGVGQSELAREFQVSVGAIHSIASGRNWKHV